MVERDITPVLRERFQQYPFVTVTGPRQSGKTTLCRAAFPELAYANLEDPAQRQAAEEDPRGFIASLGDSGIIDEVQHVPALLSYLQVIADDAGRNSMYVLTGSEQFQLTESITQSLAGRTAMLQLLPCSFAERRRFDAPLDVNEMLFSGFYPRLLDQRLDPAEALASYVETYVERDVRRLGNVRQLSSFRRFMRLCAGRIGQLLNLSALASDAGVRHNTARDWLTILEASFITFQLQPFQSNIRKRLIKSPKLYFYDVGLACYLLGIEAPEQLATHPLRGPLFENLVIAELIKSYLNKGGRPDLSFFRDRNGLECDVFDRRGGAITAIEIKAGASINSDFFGPIQRVASLVPEIERSIVVYGGEAAQTRHNVEVVPVDALPELLDPFDVGAEIDEFVRQYRSADPVKDDVERLNEAYGNLVRPDIDAVSAMLQPISEALFHTLRGTGYVKIGGYVESSARMLDSSHWERTRDASIVSRGFSLDQIEMFALEQQWVMLKYTGRGVAGFDIHLGLEWAFDDEGVHRTVTVGGEKLLSFQGTISYSALQTEPPSSDRLVAELTKELMRQIAERSAEQR